LNGLWRDIRFGVRMLAKNPAFTAIAVLTLALGIGANAGIFTILRQVILRRLPVPNPDQLVLLYSPGPKQGHLSSDESSAPGEEGAESFSYPQYLAIRDQNPVFSGLAAMSPYSTALTYRGHTERSDGYVVSGNFFETLGVKPALGRVLEPADTTSPGSAPVVVLSYAYWKSRFAGDPGVLNQGILVNNKPMTIVGVTDPSFDGTQPGYDSQLYMPITMVSTVEIPPRDLTTHKDNWIKLIGRMKPGMSLEQASAGLQPAFSAILRDELPQFKGWDNKTEAAFLARKIILRTGARGRPQLMHDSGNQVIALMSMVGLVLLIACANIAGLLTARAASRQREIGIRLSLGASRFQLVRQLLIESVLLGGAGAALGLLIASWTSSTLAKFASENGIAEGLSGGLNPTVLAFTVLVAAVCAALFGVAPSLRATRGDLVSTVKEQAGSTSLGRSHQRLRQGLVICQVALTLLLVTAAGAFAHSLFNAKHTDLGLRTDHMLEFTVAPRLLGYDDARSVALFRNLDERFAALPGVRSVSSAAETLLSDSDRGSNVDVEGEPVEERGTKHVLRNAIGPGHFSNMGIPLLAGREFTRADVMGSPKAAIVNEAFAKIFFPAGGAIGHHLRFGYSTDHPPDMEIVAVVKNSHHDGVKEEEIKPFVYAPYAQETNNGRLTYYVRTTQDPTQLSNSVRSVVNELDSSLPVTGMRTFEAQIDRQLASDRLIATLSEIFGGLAALLAAIGIYGLLAYGVTQRTREIGIRMALGAEASNVGRMILTEMSWLLLVGVVIGLPLTYGLGKLLNSMLYGVKAFEPATVGISLLFMALVAMAAAYIPARRATRVDPLVALRYE
jgi:putative ABC transport system permease protein